MLKRLNYLRSVALRKRKFITFLKLQACLKSLFRQYIVVRDERIAAMRRAFASMICSKRLLKRINMIGPTIDERERRRIKQNVTFVASNCIEFDIDKAQCCFAAFLRRYFVVKKLQQPIYKYHARINYIQRSYRDLRARNERRKFFLRTILQSKL